MLPLGCILKGVYRIERYLSAGKFSNTYVATNVQLGEVVAVKEFFINGITQRDANSISVSVSNTDDTTLFLEQMHKFWKEARRLCRLKNRHIVSIMDLFEENCTTYYVMEFVDGENLADKKPLPESEVLEYLRQISDALECMHQQGLLHLDLNPTNIMVDKTGTIKLSDFGACKLFSIKGGSAISTELSYTNGFAPREQMEQNLERIGPWTDFYALGATLYNLLTNINPPSPFDIDDDHSTDKHLALPMPSDVSSMTKQLILKLMTTDFHDRPRSVSQFLYIIDQEVVLKRKREELKRKLLSGKKVEIVPTGRMTNDPKSNISIPSGKLAGDPSCLPTYMPKTTKTRKKGFWTSIFKKGHYDNVFSSIFAPAETRRGTHLLVQVYLHLYEETETVKKLASGTDKNAIRRDYIPLQCRLKKGDTIEVILNIYDEKLLMSQKHTLSWQGSFTKCSFDYLVPKEIDSNELSCMAVLAVNGAHVGEMRFITRIVNNLLFDHHHPEVFSRQYRKIFISYAHQDEDKVRMIAMAYKAQGVDYFFDRHYLKPGDIFPIKIKEFIESADRFILCWSANAAKSDYVKLEMQYALERAFPKVKP